MHIFSLHYIVFKNYSCTVYTELLWYGWFCWFYRECRETFDLWFLFHVSVSPQSQIFYHILSFNFFVSKPFSHICAYRSHTGVKNTGITTRRRCIYRWIAVTHITSQNHPFGRKNCSSCRTFSFLSPMSLTPVVNKSPTIFKVWWHDATLFVYFSYFYVIYTFI